MEDFLIRMMKLSQGGYNCSQILIRIALEAAGRKNSELVRAMAGLAYGCGTGKATCGTLTAACCLLALFAQDSGNEETASHRLVMMQEELCAWFNDHVGQRHGGTACDTITGEGGPSSSRQVCGALLADTYAKTMAILMENGFGPGA